MVLREEVIKKVDDMKDEIVNLTCRLIGFATEVPPGDNYVKCCDFIAEKLDEIGFDVKVINVPKEKLDEIGSAPPARILGQELPMPPRVNAVAKLSGVLGKPALHVNSHFSMPPLEPGWTRDPYRAVIENDNLIGKGASDIKGGIASMLMAAAALKRRGIELKGDLYISTTCDAHLCGHAGTGYIVEKGYGKADMVIQVDVSYGTNVLMLGCRGILWGEITTFGIPYTQISPNPPNIHPTSGINAVEKMAKLIASLEEFNQRLRGITSKWPIRPDAAKYPSCVCTMIHGGTGITVVPDRCTMMFDRRLIPEERVSDAIRQIKEIFKTLEKKDKDFNAELKIIESDEPAVTPASSHLAQVLMRNIRDVTQKEPELAVKPGFKENRFFQNKWKVPTVSYGPSQHSFMKNRPSDPDEYVPISDLVSATKVLALTYMDLLGVE